jgi:acetolactate synthase-1/2/3 large subunit
MVNIVGEHATAHLKYDAPLTSDIEGLARPLSHWVRRTDTARSLATDAAMAVTKASESARPDRDADPARRRLVGRCRRAAGACRRGRRSAGAADGARRAHRRVLRSGEPTLIMLGGQADARPGAGTGGRVAATRCRLGTQFFSARIERGAGRVPLERIPYAVPAGGRVPEGLQAHRHAGDRRADRLLQLPGQAQPPEGARHHGAQPGGDGRGQRGWAWRCCSMRWAPGTPRRAAATRRAPRRRGQAGPGQHRPGLAAALPEHCILVDESLTTGRETMGLTAGAAPHDLIKNMGGSIGYARPSRPAPPSPARPPGVLHGRRRQRDVHDPVAVDPGARRPERHDHHLRQPQYQILKAEFANMGFGAPGPQALAMIDIDRPRIDWLAMAKSMGVPRCASPPPKTSTSAAGRFDREQGPTLIEVAL